MSQKLRRGEAGPNFAVRSSAISTTCAGGANMSSQLTGAADRGAEAPAEDGADIAFADVLKNASSARAASRRLDEHQPVLDLGQFGLCVGFRPFGSGHPKIARTLALVVIVVEARIRLAPMRPLIASLKST